MASESNRVIVGGTVINLDHILHVVRDARGVTIYFDMPILSQARGGHQPYELRLKGRAGQEFWQFYLGGANRVAADKVPRIDAHTS
jgi:hypothetical protein